MKAAASPDTEPDFYAMEPCPDDDSDAFSKDEYVAAEPAKSSKTKDKKHLVMENRSDFFLRDVASSVFSDFRPSTPVSSSSSSVDIERHAAVVSEYSSPVFTVPPGDMLATYYHQSFGSDSPKRNFENGDVVFFEGHKFRYLDTLDGDVDFKPPCHSSLYDSVEEV
jgi:hypothetical protein